MGINKLKPVCKPKFYSKYGIHRGLQSIKKKKKIFSSSEQCINIPETKEEEEQSSYLRSTATTDRRPHLRILADTNKRPRHPESTAHDKQYGTVARYNSPQQTLRRSRSPQGVLARPGKKKTNKHITTRESFFVNHQLLKATQD